MIYQDVIEEILREVFPAARWPQGFSLGETESVVNMITFQDCWVLDALLGGSAAIHQSHELDLEEGSFFDRVGEIESVRAARLEAYRMMSQRLASTKATHDSFPDRSLSMVWCWAAPDLFDFQDTLTATEPGEMRDVLWLSVPSHRVLLSDHSRWNTLVAYDAASRMRSLELRSAVEQQRSEAANELFTPSEGGAVQAVLSHLEPGDLVAYFIPGTGEYFDVAAPHY